LKFFFVDFCSTGQSFWILKAKVFVDLCLPGSTSRKL